MASLLPLLEMPELTDREAGVKCQSYPPRSLKNVARFYLSSRVYQRVLKESTKALLPPEQRVFRMQAGESAASVSSSVCLFGRLSCFIFVFFSHSVFQDVSASLLTSSFLPPSLPSLTYALTHTVEQYYFSLFSPFCPSFIGLPSSLIPSLLFKFQAIWSISIILCPDI